MVVVEMMVSDDDGDDDDELFYNLEIQRYAHEVQHFIVNTLLNNRLRVNKPTSGGNFCD